MIYGTVNAQNLKIADTITAADTYNALTAKFCFSKEWSGLEKIAYFRKSEEESCPFLLENDCIPARAGLNLSEGEWEVSVRGYDLKTGSRTEDTAPRLTTNIAMLHVCATLPAGEGEFPEIPKSLGEQILTIAAEAKETAENVERRANAGEFNGKDGVDGRDGVDGAPGADGTSVTVESVSESTESGGTNTVTFSDGKQLHIKNGRDGQGGGGTADESTAALADLHIKSEGAIAGRTITAGGYNADTGYKYGTTTPERYRIAKTSIYAYPQSRTYLCAEEYLLQALDFGGSGGEGELSTTGNAQQPYYTGKHSEWSRAVSVPAWTYIGINIKRADGAEIVTGASDAGLSGNELDKMVSEEVKNKLFRIADTTYDGTFRVCAFNVGCFDYGVRTGHSPHGYGDDKMFDEFMRSFDRCNANVYMFSEWDNYWNYDAQELSSNKFGALKPHWSAYDIGKDTYAYQKIASDYPIVSEETGVYGFESRHWVDCVVHVKGKDVHLISTHMALHKDKRDEATALLQQYIRNNGLEYVIVGGDFNLGIDLDTTLTSEEQYYGIVADDIAKWTDFGFKSVQGSKFGNDTYHGLMRTKSGHETYIPIKGYDNFFYSPNLDIAEVYTVSMGASDHYALCADFDIAESTGGSDVTADTVRGWGFAYMSELPDSEQLAADTDTASNAFADTLLNTRLCSVNNRTINQGHFREDRGTASASTALHPYRCRTTVYAYNGPRTYICARGYRMQMLYYGAAEKTGTGDTANYTGEHTGWSRVISFDALTYVGINIKRDDGEPITPAEFAGKLYTLNETRTDTINSESSETQIPSAKAVWELFNSIPNAEGVGF